MASASTNRVAQLYSRFSRLAAAWPVDPLRPQLSFGGALRTNVGRALLDQPPPSPPASSRAESAGIVTGGVTAGPDADLDRLKFKDLGQAEIEYAERAFAALEGLREGRESIEHPMPTSILRPKSDPEYYSRIRSAVEKAHKGESLAPTFSERVRIFFGSKR
ncbi:unnamed protein product [Parajaminaea phylloscopi]